MAESSRRSHWHSCGALSRQILCVVLTAGLFSVHEGATKETATATATTQISAMEQETSTGPRTKNGTAGDYWRGVTRNTSDLDEGEAYRHATITLNAYLRSRPASQHKVKPFRSMPGASTKLGVQVSLSLGLFAVFEVNDAKQTVSNSLFLTATWHDPQLAWNPSDFGGVETINLAEDSIWRPSVVVVNSVNRVDVLSDPFHVKVWSTGRVIAENHFMLETSCNMDLRSYPYDTQRCPLVFHTYNTDVFVELEIYPMRTMSAESMTFSSEWELQGANTSAVTLEGHRFQFYWFTMERRTTFYTMCLVLPLVLTSYMNTLVFLLPVQCGEKASFVVTMFVSTSFFFGFLSGVMPKGLDNVPLIMKLLDGVVLQSLFVLLVTVFVLRGEMKADDVTGDVTDNDPSSETAGSPTAYAPKDPFAASSLGFGSGDPDLSSPGSEAGEGRSTITRDGSRKEMASPVFLHV